MIWSKFIWYLKLNPDQKTDIIISSMQYCVVPQQRKKKKKKQKIEFPSVGSFPVDQAIPGDDTLVCELDKLLNMIRDMQQL